MTSIADDFLFPPFSERTEPRLTLPLCRRDGKRLGGGFEKRTSVADFVHADGGLTKRMVRWTTGDGWWRRPSPKGVTQSTGTTPPSVPVRRSFSCFRILVLRGLGHFLAVRGERLAAALFVQPARVVDLDRALHRAMTSALVRKRQSRSYSPLRIPFRRSAIAVSWQYGSSVMLDSRPRAASTSRPSWTLSALCP